MDARNRQDGRARGWPALVACLVTGCSGSAASDDAQAPAPEAATVKAAAQALAGAQVPTLDPAVLNDAEIDKVIGEGPRCTFHYTSSGPAVLAASLAPGGAPTAGVVKLNGSLVPLQRGPGSTAEARSFILAAAPLRLSVQWWRDAPTPGRRVPADLVFDVERQLKVGYGGFLACGPTALDPVATR